jgi:cobalt-zinc-cadmium efflux system protein
VTHDKHAGHDHAAGVTNRTRLMVAIGIVAVFLVVEVVGAALSGSLALLADAGHMLSDVFGLTVALVALVVAARPATDRQTFGYQRAEVFGALVNGVILSVVAVFVAVEGVGRLVDPGEVEVLGTPMLLVAVVGLGANVASMLVLRGGKSESIGMRGAYLEVLGDFFGSVTHRLRAGRRDRVARDRRAHRASRIHAAARRLPRSQRVGAAKHGR